MFDKKSYLKLTKTVIGDRLGVGQEPLELLTGVRIPVSEPTLN
jgi:hypothetical protein